MCSSDLSISAIISPTMEEGTLAKWMVKEGDRAGIRIFIVMGFAP